MIDKTLAVPVARRPMATVRRVSLYEREIRVHLSTAAIELLFDLAQVLHEGGKREPLGTAAKRRASSGGSPSYFGSTMITIDLARAAPAVRDECDAAAAQRVAELVGKDARVQARAKLMARAAAEERAGGTLERVDIDLRVRAAGSRVHLDLDVEGGS